MNDITDFGNFASEYVSFYKADYFTTSRETNLPDGTISQFECLESCKKTGSICSHGVSLEDVLDHTPWINVQNPDAYKFVWSRYWSVRETPEPHGYHHSIPEHGSQTSVAAYADAPRNRSPVLWHDV